MLPANGSFINAQVIRQPTHTYKFHFMNNRIIQYSDGIEAMQQFIYKTLQTDRYRHEIYDWNYGFEIDDLMGKPLSYAKAKLPRRIIDALICDDRVLAVNNFSFPIPDDNVYSQKRNTVVIAFNVNTIYGSISVSKAVFI